jgi:hypothetical protein
MARNEIPELRKHRNEYDRARRRLFASIHKYLARGDRPSDIARSVDWSDSYIAKIRDEDIRE